MEGEHLLHTDAVGDAAAGEGLLNTAVLLGDNGTLEHLDTLAVAFLNLQVHPDGVAHLDDRGLLLVYFSVKRPSSDPCQFPPVV